MPHPVIVVPKLVLLLILVIVLAVLHQSLGPEQFWIAAIVAVASFIASCVVLWVLLLRALRNPESRSYP